MEIYKIFTAKGEPAYYINRFYYTKFRVNKKNNSIYYKCREKNLENRNCHASVVFDQNDILVPEDASCFTETTEQGYYIQRNNHFQARIRVGKNNSTASSSSKIYASQIDSTSTDQSKPLFKMPYDPKAWSFRSFPLNNYDVDASSLDTL